MSPIIYTPSEVEIDSGAAALRERNMAGKITRTWREIPNSSKRKWREQASAVLIAAYHARAKLMAEIDKNIRSASCS